VWLLGVVGVALILVLGACRTSKSGASGQEGTGLAAPTELAIGDDTTHLLLTWVDERGDFHVEQALKDVPEAHREWVRVVDTTKEEASGASQVLVADLRTPKADGKFALRSMARTKFDEIALERRSKFTTTLAAAASAQRAAAAVGDGGGPLAAPRRMVIIYGASWCGACHEAAAWLKGQNIEFVEKDIEADAKADDEMREKLRGSGQRGGSIPVIDVRGIVLVGFNPDRMASALRQTAGH
jgi:glutaredoxin